MPAFLATSIAPRLNLTLLRRDFFDGFSLLLQDEDGIPFDLSAVQVCASAWKTDSEGVTSQVLDFNIEEQEPLKSGRIRFWLTSQQTNQLWQELQSTQPQGVFFPSAYTEQVRPTLFWEVRIEREEELASLVEVNNGTFITQTNHMLGATERVIFKGTDETSINYDNTSSTIYSNLTNISYLAPYSFTISALSSLSSDAICGSVYRLKQDTVAAGSIDVGSTITDCFP